MAQTFHKFKAETFDQAYQAMRRKLGSEAVVIRTTSVMEGGIFGFMAHKLVEVTASAPASRKLSSVEQKYLTSGTQSPGAGVGSETRVKETVAYFQQLVIEAQERTGIKAKPAVRSTQRAPSSPMRGKKGAEDRDIAPPFSDELRSDIHELREMLSVMSAEMPEGGMPAEYVPHYRMLIERGLSRTGAARLVEAARQGFEPSSTRDGRVFVQRLKMEIRKSVGVTGGIALEAGLRRVVALVGATGVGKTTNLAKLAANYSVRERARVGLITADTYRVAAADQLRTYAQIIGIEMKVVHDAKEMVQATHAFREHDLVLIDTAGGSPFNATQMEDVRSIVDAAQPDEVMLLVCAATPLNDMRELVKRFSIMKPSSLFFTKLDETPRFGSAYCLAADGGLALSYFSIGQNVPDDLTLAHGGSIAELVIEHGEDCGTASKKSA